MAQWGWFPEQSRAEFAWRELGQPTVGTWGKGAGGEELVIRKVWGRGWETGAWRASQKSSLPGQDGRGRL